MAFTINTNIASLQSQEYLRITNEFQQKTINRVTSGLRIISSGDDAAGLAIANGFRSDRSVLTQGVRNANDGLSTLQTIDGGLNNISQLLDRARTLATQSASGTFTGDRSVLDSEFQSVVNEIDRQAQAIGLNETGEFAKNISVFIGGGRGPSDAEKITNGSIGVDLSESTVDVRSLGLKGLQVTGANAADVDEIVADTTNTGSVAVPGYTDFYFRGPGFADNDRVRVAVNLSGVDDAEKLALAVNSAIDQAGSGGTGPASAFKDAGVRAEIVDDGDGNPRLVFQSANSAFQITAGDRLANALLGNHSGNVGEALDYAVQGAGAAASTGTAFDAAQNVIVRVQGGSLDSPVDLTLSVSTGTTVQSALTSLSSLVAGNSALIAAGIDLSTASAGSNLVFTSKRGENFEVLAAGDNRNLLGLGTAQFSAGTAGTAFDVTSIPAGALGTAVATQTLGFSIGGSAGYITVAQTFSSATTASDVVNTLNNLFASNATLQQAGLVAATSGSSYTVSSNNGTYFRVNLVSASGAGEGFGFGTSSGSTATTALATTTATTSATLNSGGASTSGLLAFSPLRAGNEDQTITITTKDGTGVEQTAAITLRADAAGQHGRSIDEVLDHINDQLRASPSAALQNIVAVKERDEAAGGAERIRFLSSQPDFKVSVGASAGGTGVFAGTGPTQGSVVSSSLLTGGANINIASQDNAEAAVAALAKAVEQLGDVQAVVGRGQNQLNFAISLAQTQISNLAASESRIRDADLAAEAANLAKAQVLQQAGIAALAQANAAPQAVLRLLQG